MVVIVRISVRRIRKFITDESGVSSLEYAVLLALICVCVILAVKSLGQSTSQTFSSADIGLQTMS